MIPLPSIHTVLPDLDLDGSNHNMGTCKGRIKDLTAPSTACPTAEGLLVQVSAIAASVTWHRKITVQSDSVIRQGDGKGRRQ